jgi:hypothetical protein
MPHPFSSKEKSVSAAALGGYHRSQGIVIFMNWLQVFRRIEVSHGAQGKGSWVYAGGAVRKMRRMSWHHSGQECALIAMVVDPYAPETPIARVSAFCFYF